MSQSSTVHTAQDVARAPAAKVPQYAWVILLVAYLASVMAPLNQNKVPPLMPILIDTFQINLSQAGLLMSVFGVTGFILALPAGFILQKWGLKLTGLVALAGLTAGAVLGALSTTMGLLLTSRILEGVGMGLIAVVAPAAIAVWFPRQKQGTPMGIWATWVPLGNLIMLVLAPALAITYGWRSVWWLGAGLGLAIFVLYGLLMRVPPATPGEEPELESGTGLWRALLNRNIWLLAFAFCCFNLVFVPLATFYPTFLSEVRGYTLSQASLVASLSTGLVLVSAPLAGWVSDRIGSRRLVFSIPFLAIAAMMALPFQVTGWQIYAFLSLLGLVAGAVPTATFAAAPEVMRTPQLAGLGLAVIILGQNLGMFAAPVAFGKLVETIGWTAAGYWLVPVGLLGFLAAWTIEIR